MKMDPAHDAPRNSRLAYATRSPARRFFVANSPTPQLVVLALAAACIGSDCHWHLSINNPHGTSTLVIQTVTTGSAIDRDGYTVTVTGAGLQEPGSRRFQPNAAETFHFNGVRGEHLIQLSDVADNCRVSGRNPRPVDLVPGARSETTFEIRCRAAVP